MGPKIIRNLEFIELLSNFTFNIGFYQEKNPNGKLCWFEEHGEWLYNKDIEYYNFDIEFNGYELNDGLNNWKENRYGVYLEEKLRTFTDENDISYLTSFPISHCYDQLTSALEKLEYISTQFYDEKIKDEQSPFIYEVPKHHKIILNFSDRLKVYDENEDRLLNEIISFFITRQHEVIGATVKFLKNKLQMLTMRKVDDIPKSIPAVEKSSLIWTKSDTDLLELVTALYELKAISNNQNDLKRKDAIEFFSKVFGREIKDSESKLSRATERKKDISPFLSNLKESFDNYAIKKDER